MSRKKTWNRKAVWKVFSEYIRLKYADADGLCKCVTCGKVDQFKKMQAGHFVDGRNNTVLLDERIVHPQCYRCNITLKGNKIQYMKFMIEKYGYSISELTELDNLRHKTKFMSKADWAELGESYSEKIEFYKKRIEEK